jgi:hypothetical protein
MGDIVTFGVTLVPAAICLITAAVFRWAPYFSDWSWPKYAILPLLLAGVAGAMNASIAGISISGLINGGLNRVYSGMSHAVPGLAWVLALGAAGIVTFFAIGHMLAGEVDKRGAWLTGGLPVAVAIIPAPLGTFLIAVLGFVVSIPIFILGKMWGN